MVVFFFVLFVVSGLSLLNLLTVFRLEKATKNKRFPKVSLLIPLRNEEKRVVVLCEQLKKIEYPNLEMILLDDESIDGTWQKLQEFSDSKIQMVRGQKLPQGWVGKSWACHQLSQLATGEVLLFCDADVTMSVNSVDRTVALLESHQVDAITALPYQRMNFWFEKAIIPFVMHLPVFGLLPLRWMSLIKNPRVLVANGQWFAIRKEIYQKSGGHRSCSSSLLEDMKLGEQIKKQGGKLLPVLSTEDVQVRMYDSWENLEEGFTKNLYLLAGGNLGSLLFMMGLSIALYLIPLFKLGTFWGSATFGLLLLFRVVTALAFRAPVLSVALHPIGAIGFIYLLGRSGWGHWTEYLTWKGRSVFSP